MLQTVLGSRISFELAIAERPLAVEADINQFETVMVNLAANARDAMEGRDRLPSDSHGHLTRFGHVRPAGRKFVTGESLRWLINRAAAFPPIRSIRFSSRFLRLRRSVAALVLACRKFMDLCNKSAARFRWIARWAPARQLRLHLPLSSKPIQPLVASPPTSTTQKNVAVFWW